MPAYTYECDKCGDVFDVRRGMADESPVVCTTCHSKGVRRVYHALAMVSGGEVSSGSSSGSSAAFEAGTSGCCSGGMCGC